MKRFTETSKWTDPWFRNLPMRLKCLWHYLCDCCDVAGVIDPDFAAMAFHIGGKFTAEDAGAFGGRVEVLPNGKWRVVKFIQFQYGKLLENCKPHAAVFAALSKHGVTLSEGYPKGIQRDMDMDKDKEKEKEEDAREQKPPTSKPPCTEDEAWEYARNSHVAPKWTREAVAKWYADRSLRNWRTKGDIQLKADNWRHDLRGAHGWAIETPRNGSKPAKQTRVQF